MKTFVVLLVAAISFGTDGIASLPGNTVVCTAAQAMPFLDALVARAQGAGDAQVDRVARGNDPPRTDAHLCYYTSMSLADVEPDGAAIRRTIAGYSWVALPVKHYEGGHAYRFTIIRVEQHQGPKAW